MESGCEELKGILGDGTSLIALLEVCTKLVANINDIRGLIVGGDCAGACAEQSRVVEYSINPLSLPACESWEKASCNNALLALDVDETVEHDDGEMFDN
eukprot:5082401-Ditylum_brightwellii.AAC.1